MSEELVKALKWIGEDAPNYIRRYGALYPKPASEMQAVALKALAAHKAKPTKEDVENWINNGFDAKKIYQNGRKYGFEEGFSVGRKSAGLEDIKVQFEEPPIKKPALSEEQIDDKSLHRLVCELLANINYRGDCSPTTKLMKILRPYINAAALNVAGE